MKDKFSLKHQDASIQKNNFIITINKTIQETILLFEGGKTCYKWEMETGYIGEGGVTIYSQTKT